MGGFNRFTNQTGSSNGFIEGKSYGGEFPHLSCSKNKMNSFKQLYPLTYNGYEIAKKQLKLQGQIGKTLECRLKWLKKICSFIWFVDVCGVKRAETKTLGSIVQCQGGHVEASAMKTAKINADTHTHC